jgi:hypothetical protein
MCTVVILRRPGHDWPLVLGANRDEMRDRPWTPPGRHWAERADVVAGKDDLSGGSWLGLNDHGVVACILNRRNSLGPLPGKRSRGELVLEALDAADAAAAAANLVHLDPTAYRSFNLVIADNRDAFWLRSLGQRDSRVEAFPIPDGVSMLTARDINDPDSPRIARHLEDFRLALPPAPELEDWNAWQELMARPASADPFDAMTIATEQGFGTVSSSLLALPAAGLTRAGEPERAVWLFAAGPPDSFPYQPVGL